MKKDNGNFFDKHIIQLKVGKLLEEIHGKLQYIFTFS